MEGYHQHYGGCSVSWRDTISTMRDMINTARDTIFTLEGYHQDSRGYSLLRRNTMSTVGGFLFNSLIQVTKSELKQSLSF